METALVVMGVGFLGVALSWGWYIFIRGLDKFGAITGDMT